MLDINKKKMRPYLTPKADLDLCKTMVLPMFDYSNIFITHTTLQEEYDLRVIQNNALCCSFGIKNTRDVSITAPVLDTPLLKMTTLLNHLGLLVAICGTHYQLT